MVTCWLGIISQKHNSAEMKGHIIFKLGNRDEIWESLIKEEI